MQDRPSQVLFLPLLPPIPPLNLQPPQLSAHSYTLYYQKKHQRLINGQGEEQFASGTEQISTKHASLFELSQKTAKLHQGDGTFYAKQLGTRGQRTVNITSLVKCQRCMNWLSKTEIKTHMTFHGSIILDNLILGDKFSSQSRKQLIQRLKVTHVVNAASELQNKFESDGLNYFNLDLFDDMFEDVIGPCLKAAEFIENACHNGGRVFVHCALGKSRSVSVILIYLIKYHGLSFSQSLSLIKQKRSIIRPNPNYLAQLQKFYQTFVNQEKQHKQTSA